MMISSEIRAVKKRTTDRVIVNTLPLFNVVNGKSTIVSGAFKVLANEVEKLGSGESVLLLTPEPQATLSQEHYCKITVSPDVYIPSAVDAALFSSFLGGSSTKGGLWQLFHPFSHSVNFPDVCSKEVFEDLGIDGKNIEAFIAYLDEQISKLKKYEANYFSGYEEAFARVPERCTLYLDGYATLGAFTCKNFPVHSSRHKIVLRLHESIPANLKDSQIGRDRLRRISQADTVLVVADAHKETLSCQLQFLNLPVPNIVSHRLGINFSLIKEVALRINQDNYQKLIPGFEDLDLAQKILLKDAIETRGKVPNRFYVGDGPDPIKGLYQALVGIDDFLSSLDMSLEEMKLNYRFYLTQYQNRAQSHDNSGLLSFSESYRLKCSALRDELIRKYPGIIIASDAFRGLASVAVYVIMPYCNFLSGSLEDSLHLMCQEAAYANYLHRTDCMIIVGKNAGFSGQVQREGGCHLGYFVDSSQGKNISQAIRIISDSTQKQWYSLRRMLNQQLVEKHILTRDDSLFNYW